MRAATTGKVRLLDEAVAWMMAKASADECYCDLVWVPAAAGVSGDFVRLSGPALSQMRTPAHGSFDVGRSPSP